MILIVELLNKNQLRNQQENHNKWPMAKYILWWWVIQAPIFSRNMVTDCQQENQNQDMEDFSSHHKEIEANH